MFMVVMARFLVIFGNFYFASGRSSAGFPEDLFAKNLRLVKCFCRNPTAQIL